MLLILSNKLDATTDVVIKGLNTKHIPFVRWNVEDMMCLHRITFEMSSGKIRKAELRAEGRTVDLARDISVIWNRRPGKIRTHPAIRRLSHREFAMREGLTILNNVWALLERKIWINHPTKNLLLNNKLHQLELADRLGIATPPTLLTNDPSEAMRFRDKHGEIAAKPLSAGVIQDANGESMMYTRKLKDGDMARLEGLKLCPVLLQAYVPKTIELRVTVIDKNIFSCAIESQSSMRTTEDWRRYDFSNVPHYPFDLPKDLGNKLIAFMKQAGIRFGAFDFILTPDGQFVFLEINPNGQWYWIEKLTGLPIADTLVEAIKHSVR
jgi:glutathione synthase/RimK-type ligase-like ATP-grasp enzyme